MKWLHNNYKCNNQWVMNKCNIKNNMISKCQWMEVLMGKWSRIWMVVHLLIWEAWKEMVVNRLRPKVKAHLLAMLMLNQLQLRPLLRLRKHQLKEDKSLHNRNHLLKELINLQLEVKWMEETKQLNDSSIFDFPSII